MYKQIILLFVLSILLSYPAFSQDENEEENSDTTETWNWQDFKFEFDNFNRKGRPAVNLEYGISKMNFKNSNTSFAKPNLLELKLGHVSEYPVEMDKIVKYRFTNLFLSYISTDLSNKSGDDIKTNLWRFGAGWSSGYGYKFGKSSLVLYNSGSVVWSRLDLKDSIPNAEDRKRLDRFNETFRFGTNAEGGIRFKILPLFSIDAGYERAVIFERHLFWKWLGSEVIYLGAQGLLDAFINEIKDSTPFAVPVVNFILKNALSYGVYELRQEKMNWPFKTSAPLAYDQFKFGVTFTF